ncbi:MAG: response regulator [Polymorphobacter sp.]
MTILLIEDDDMLADAIVDGLRPRFLVERVASIDHGEAAIQTGDYDMVILDIALPDGSGLDLLARLRRGANTLPVLILSARTTLDDRLAGLNGGADDYLVKPFDLGELTARCDAVIRRRQGRAAPDIVHGDIRYVPAARQVTLRGDAVALSAREMAVLDVLLSNIGHVISKAQIEERLYRWNEAVESNTIEVHVSHLRRKLGPDWVKTIRGLGYLVPLTP